MFLTQESSMSVVSGDRDSAVFQAIENVLDDYPEYPYQVAFSIKELHQKLVAHVLRHLPRSYATTVDGKPAKANAKFPYRSKAERIRLDALIRGSILHILRENADWVGRHIEQKDSSNHSHLETLSRAS